MQKMRDILKWKSLRTKLSFLTGIGAAIILLIIIVYSAVIIHRKAVNTATHQTEIYLQEFGHEIKTEIEQPLSAIRTLAQSFSAINAPLYPLEINREQANSMLIKMLRENPKLQSIYSIWEPNAFDGRDSLYANSRYSDKSGRYIIRWEKGTAGHIEGRATTNYETEGRGDFYLLPKRSKKEAIIDPYEYLLAGKPADMISVVVPVISNNKFQGVVGGDLPINWIQRYIDSRDIFNGNATLAVISGNGTLVALSGRQELIGENMKAFFEDNYAQHLQNLKNGIETVQKNDEKLEIYAPLLIGETDTPWQVYLSVSNNYIATTANRQIIFLIIIGILLIASGLTLLFFFLRRSITPLQTLTQTAQKIAGGRLEKANVRTYGDEIEHLKTAFDKMVESLQEITEIGESIAQGDLTRTVNVKNDNDVLAISINKMIESLRHAKEEEERRRIEDNQRNWGTQGLAKFGDILRQTNQDVEELADSIVSNLVEYVDANLGGLYIYNDDNKDDLSLELTASYAYNRKKFIDKKVLLGEGLVGTCAIEKETIYLTEIPADYVKITSGMGGTRPQSLLIVPLKVDNQIFGVLELASLTRFESYQIEFVEKIGESIASTLSSVKINNRTAALLAESRQQAEDKAAQEEEMRQNMEELQATQEESARREAEMTGLLTAIDHTTLRAEFDLNGKLITANNNFLEKLEYEIEEVQGRSIRIFVPDRGMEEFDSVWRQVARGQQHESIVQRKTKNGEMIWLLTSFTPIYTTDGTLQKILYLANDITEQKQIELEAQKLANDLKNNQEEMVQKQKEIEKANQKMKTNQVVLEKALTKAKSTEQEIKEKNEQMAAQEEEMRQNLEILTATQEEMESKQAEIEAANAKMKSNADILEKALAKARKSETQLKEQHEQMKSQEEELRQNMEELQATQDQLQKDAQEKEKMQQETEKARRFIKAILDSLPVPVFVKDREHQFVMVNQAVCDLNQITRDELIGKTDFDLFPRQLAEKLWAFEEKVFADKGKMLQKTEEINRGGKILYTIDKEVAIEVNNELLLVGTSYDITEQKTVQLELKKINNQIREQENIMRQNMEELQVAQQEMEHKQQELEAANNKLTTSSEVLRKALEKAKQNEKENKALNDTLKEQEEEMRLNMEELVKTQEESERKQAELEKVNAQMKENEKNLKKELIKAGRREIEIEKLKIQLDKKMKALEQKTLPEQVAEAIKEELKKLRKK